MTILRNSVCQRVTLLTYLAKRTDGRAMNHGQASLNVKEDDSQAPGCQKDGNHISVLRISNNERHKHNTNNNHRTLQHDSYQQFTVDDTSFPLDRNRKNMTSVRDLANRIRL